MEKTEVAAKAEAAGGVGAEEKASGCGRAVEVIPGDAMEAVALEVQTVAEVDLPLPHRADRD